MPSRCGEYRQLTMQYLIYHDFAVRQQICSIYLCLTYGKLVITHGKQTHITQFKNYKYDEIYRYRRVITIQSSQGLYIKVILMCELHSMLLF